MKNNLKIRLNKLYENKNSINHKSMMKKIREMTPEQREKRIAELKKKFGLRGLTPDQFKKKLAELHSLVISNNKQKE
jgi:ribosomal protein L29